MTLKLFNYRYGLPPNIIAEGFKRFTSLTHSKMGEPSFKIFYLPHILVVIFSQLFHQYSISNMGARVKGYERNENTVVLISVEFDRLLKPFKSVSSEESIPANEQIQKNRNADLFEMSIGRLLKVMPSESKMTYERGKASPPGHAGEQPLLEIVGKQWKKSVKEIGLVILLLIYFVRASTAYCLLDSRKSKNYLTNALNLFLSNGLNISPIRDTLERCKTKFADFMTSCDSYYRLNNLAKFNTSCVMTVQQINNERLASFRPFPSSNIPSCLSFIKLAEAGFLYSGNGTNVKCVGCGKEEQVDKFEHGGKMLDPEASMFHNIECKFVKPELYNREYIALPVVFPETGVQDSSLAIINGFQCAEIATQDQEELSDQRSPEISPCESEPRESNLLIQPQEHLEPLANAFAAEFHQEQPSPLDLDSLGAAAASRDYQSGASAIDDSTWKEDNLWESNFNPEHASYGNDDQTASLPMHQVPCDKNPGHYAYFPLRQLNLQQIPSAMRTGDGIKFLKLLGDLTVRVKVLFNRKLNKPDGSNCIFGTGYVSLAEQTAKVSGELGSHGKLDNLKKKMTSLLNKTKEYIIIETNKHILCKAEDAQITVEFFYDHPSRRDVKVVKAVSVTHSKTSGDNRSILTCATSDQSFVKKINQTRVDVLELANKLPKRAKELMMKKLFIISHPHGNEKILSYGDSVLVKYAIMQAEKDGCIEKRLVKINNHQQVTRSPEQMKQVLLYAADTCFGSSGAPVVTFKRGAPDANGQPTYHLDLWMHNGVEKNIKLGASNLRGIVTLA